MQYIYVVDTFRYNNGKIERNICTDRYLDSYIKNKYMSNKDRYFPTFTLLFKLAKKSKQ